MTRLFALFTALFLLAACTNPDDLDEAPTDLGDFHLGHNVAVAPNLTKGPASRDATKEEWIAAMTGAIEERFGRYEGDRLYHMGISIEGYVLAVPGVPIVASPKSALILRVTLWDDAAGRKLNDKPHQVTVIESFSADTMLGSGLTQSKEKQIENLSRNAAKLIENWMVRENARNGWFETGGQPTTSAQPSETAPDPAQTATPPADGPEADPDAPTEAAG